MYRAAVLTVSDRVSRGERPDEGGPLVAELLKNAGYEVVRTDVVPDEQAQIEAALRQMADGGDIQLLVTTGGTGFAPRDVTPEATLAVCDRLTPGIPEAMRYASMQITSRAMLSRAQAGIRKGTLILNLPGSPKAAQENLEAVLPAIGHGLEMLSGRPADCAKLTQVVYNLMENAIKYTQEGGAIKVRLIRSGRDAVMTVTDNGPGIPREDQAHIFDRFYRVDKARSRESGGTGLGLSIAKEIVERHHGSLRLVPREGRGTTIRLVLPIDPTRAE